MISYTEWSRMASLPWDHPESMYHQRYHRSINRQAFWFILVCLSALFADVGGHWYFGLIPLSLIGVTLLAIGVWLMLFCVLSPLAKGLAAYFKGE